MNGLALSILVAKVERTVHDENGFCASNVESDYYYYNWNMDGHYNNKNVVQEQYLHLPVASSFVLPWHVMTQVQNALLQVQILIQAWRGFPQWHAFLHKSHIY